MSDYLAGTQPIDEEEFKARACDPRASVIVEACAGSGKTWLLVGRIVRALLDGAAPGQILAITFTRRAAQEMRARLLKEVETAGFSRNYSGIRTSKRGRRFRIEGAVVFNLLGEREERLGQAATFREWTYL